jgi:hypothetical protein
MLKCCSILMTRDASLDLTDTSGLLYYVSLHTATFFSFFSGVAKRSVRVIL